MSHRPRILIGGKNTLQKSKTRNSLIVLWNEIEGNTKSLSTKHLDFIDVISYKTESEREEKVKNCIYTYYQLSTTNLLEYIKERYPCFEQEEVTEILKKCLFVKVLKNEIPDLIASYIYSRLTSSSNMSLPEDYCFNWSNPLPSMTPCQTFYKLLDDLKQQLSRHDNVHFFRCSIFFHSEGFEMQNESNNSKLRTFHWCKEFPFQVSKVNDTTSVLHIYWRHYDYVLRRIEEFRCLQDNTTSLQHNFMNFLLYHEERYFENAYVINLRKRPDRRLFWETDSNSSLNKLSSFLQPTIVEAVDAIEVMEDVLEYENYKEQIEKIMRENRRFPKLMIEKLNSVNSGFILNPQRYILTPLNQGEYGILMSNIRIMSMALQKEHLYTFILEDDARFHTSFKEEWYRIALSLPADWNVLALGTKNYHTPLHTSSKFHFFNEFTTGAHAMIYRRDALETLVPFLTEYPCLAFDELLKIAMLLWPDKLRGYVIDPSLVITLCGEDSLSDIQSYSKHSTETYDFFHWNASKYDLF
jgi:GR25 family glycosyltransferase involved in LPS biosynthesis